MPHQPARHRIRPLILGCAALVLVAVLGNGIALAASQAVTISNFAFAPASVTVSVGDTVTWTNSDAVTHTATADDASWDAGNITGNGGTGAFVFPTAGTFPFHCRIHSQMTATVIVQAAGATAPATGATAVPGTMRPTDTAPIGTGTTGTGDRLLAMVVIAMLAAAVGFAVLVRRPAAPMSRTVPVPAVVGGGSATPPSTFEAPAFVGPAADERSLAPIVIVGIASAVAVAIVWRRLTARR